MAETKFPLRSAPMEHQGAVERIDAALVRLVRRATDQRLIAVFNRWAGVDVERSAFVLLARIEELGPARLSEVAAAADIDVSTASRQVAPLVEQVLVAKEADPADGRVTVLRLTPRGSEVLRRLRSARRVWLDGILREFDDEQREAFADLFSRFVAGIERPA
jgi:DNA-binding MarR family transcriptional regulator